MSGPEIQANAIWTALHGLSLRDAGSALDIALVTLLAFAVPLLRLRLRVLPAALAGPFLALAFLAAAQAAFDHGTVEWVCAPLPAIAVGTVTMVIVSHLSESAVSRRAPVTTTSSRAGCRSARRSCARRSWRSCSGSAAPPSGVTRTPACTWRAWAGSASASDTPRAFLGGHRATRQRRGGARHRQDRHPRPHPAQAWTTDARGAGGDGAARARRGVDALRVAIPRHAAGRDHRTDAPRAPGRRGLPQRPLRQRHPARRTDLRDAMSSTPSSPHVPTRRDGPSAKRSTRSARRAESTSTQTSSRRSSNSHRKRSPSSTTQDTRAAGRRLQPSPRV